MDERQAEAIVDLVKTDLTTASPRSRRASTLSPPRPTSPRSKTVYHHALRGGRGHRRAGHGPRFLHRPVDHAGRFQPTGISAYCADAPGIRRLSELEDVLGAAHAGRASLPRRRQAFAAPRTAQRLGWGVSHKILLFGEFCTTKHLHSTSTKHLYSGPIPSTKHLHHIQVVLIK